MADTPTTKTTAAPDDHDRAIAQRRAAARNRAGQQAQPQARETGLMNHLRLICNDVLPRLRSAKPFTPGDASLT